MSKEEYLLKLYNSYPNARFFTFNNGNLRLEIKDKKWEIAINNVNFENINANIFVLHPIEAFQIIYMLELLHHPNLQQNELSIITSYTQKYIELSDEVLSNNDGIDEIKSARCNLLGIPIYTAYDEKLIELPASKVIQEMLNNHSRDIESGKSKQNRLVLKNPNGTMNIEEELPNNFINYGTAGFITLALIVGVVAITVAYITTYILNK